MKTETIPVMIGALGLIKKGLAKHMEKIPGVISSSSSSIIITIIIINNNNSDILILHIMIKNCDGGGAIYF